jgi:hypothetical protein
MTPHQDVIRRRVAVERLQQQPFVRSGIRHAKSMTGEPPQA